LVAPSAAVGRWIATLLLLTLEHIGFRHRQTRLAALLAVLEPVAIIALLSAVHALMSPAPAFGQSHLLFYASGVLPFYLFFHVSWRMRQWGTQRRLPRTSELDLVLSHLLSELIIKIAFFAIFCVVLLSLGIRSAIPARPLDCLFAFIALALLGVGIGLANAVIASFFSVWVHLYSIVTRVLLISSGVLYVVDLLPKPFRDVVVENPIAHGITWFRLGQYGNYPTLTLDLLYLAISVAIALALGWLIHASTQEWRSSR